MAEVTVKEYFEEEVPKIFEEQMAKTQVAGMEGTVFILQFDIVGDETQSYSLTIKDAKELEVNPGPQENAMLKVVLAEDVWRNAVTGQTEGAMDMFTDMGQVASRQSYDALQGTRGTVDIELTMPDGSVTQTKMVLNGADSPQVTLKAALEDWIAMQKGELAGPTAFMSGKLKLEGDMAFAMSLGNLMGG
jgi:putative sterol carrier protein